MDTAVRYLTQDDCDRMHEKMDELNRAKEDKYKEIIKVSVEDRHNLWEQKEKLEEQFTAYKNTINGKFDRIMTGVIVLLIGVVGTLITTIWTSHSTQVQGAERFEQLNSIRKEQEQVSGTVVKEYQRVIQELKSQQRRQ